MSSKVWKQISLTFAQNVHNIIKNTQAKLKQQMSEGLEIFTLKTKYIIVEK